MNDLNTLMRAKMYMDQLAQGIDPISGQEMPDDSILNHVRLARCFFYVSGVLEQIIANGEKYLVLPKKLGFQFRQSRLLLFQFQPNRSGFQNLLIYCLWRPIIRCRKNQRPHYLPTGSSQKVF